MEKTVAPDFIQMIQLSFYVCIKNLQNYFTHNKFCGLLAKK